MGECNYDPSNPVLVCTDGLLKERLLFGSNLPDIIILDEVHERSVNIDFSIALLAKMMSENPNKSLKVILSSATIDPEVYRFTSNGIPVECIEIGIPSPYIRSLIHPL